MNSCALLAWLLCRVLVLVRMGDKGFHLGQGRYEWGVFHVTFQDRYFLFDTVIVSEQKSTEAFSVQGGLLSEVFTRRSLKRYFSRRSTKQQWQVHRGDTFQPQGLTPAPMTRRTSSSFSPRRFCLYVWTIFRPREKKAKGFGTEPERLVPVSVYLYQPSFPDVLFSPSCPYVNVQSFFLLLFLYLTVILYCASRCKKYIGNKDFYYAYERL